MTRYFSDLRLLIILLCYVTAFMFVVSTDSPLYYPFGRFDSAAFFMAGKAWMNGMVPYTEFSDGKGPFLWLIYGVGYLISPTSYAGVLWLSIVSTAIALFFLYKTARLYATEGQSILATLLMPIMLFNPLFHDETRVETFCWPFISMSTYIALRFCQMKRLCSKKDFFISAILWGISFALTLLMKYTIAAMLIICLIVMMLSIPRESKKHRMTILVGAIIGVSIVIIPFAIYFLCNGNLANFIHEYFVVIIKTDRMSAGNLVENVILNYLQCIGLMLFNHSYMLCVTFAFMLVGTFLFCKLREKGEGWRSYAPFIIHIWFLAISTYHSIYLYYFESTSTFFLFTLLLFLVRFHIEMTSRKALTGGIVVCFLSVILITHPFRHHAFRWYKDKSDLEAYRETDEVMKSVGKHPRILNLFLLEMGAGIGAETLPACKYWFFQNGGTADMSEDQVDAIRYRKADVIITFEENELIPTIQSSGYQRYIAKNKMPYVLFIKQ